MHKNKLILPISIILGTVILGGFYYASQVNKQNSIERQQQIEIEMERQERIDEQQAREEAKQALNDCIADAEFNYQVRWYEECKSLGKLTNRCIDFDKLSFYEYLEKYKINLKEYLEERNLPSDPDGGAGSDLATAITDYALRARAKKDECSCRLSISKADRLNEALEKNKEECFKRHPQN